MDPMDIEKPFIKEEIKSESTKKYQSSFAILWDLERG